MKNIFNSLNSICMPQDSFSPKNKMRKAIFTALESWGVFLKYANERPNKSAHNSAHIWRIPTDPASQVIVLFSFSSADSLFSIGSVNHPFRQWGATKRLSYQRNILLKIYRVSRNSGQSVPVEPTHCTGRVGVVLVSEQGPIEENN